MFSLGSRLLVSNERNPVVVLVVVLVVEVVVRSLAVNIAKV